MKENTVMAHLEKIASLEDRSIFDYLKSTIKGDRLEEIRVVFGQVGDSKLSPVKEILGDDYSYEEIRLARLFLD